MPDYLIPLAINGLVWGMIIALIALGLSIIFGLLDIINIAHGDFFMVGTVLAWSTLQFTGNYWLGFLVVPVIAFVLGMIMERLVIRPIRNTAALSIVATFGLSLILQESVRATFGATPRRILPPIEGTIPMFGIEYEIYRLFAALVSALVLAGFFLFLKRTKTGTWMRAVRHDRDTAIAMGIPAQRVYMLTFAIGTALAALGGMVAAPITTVDFRAGVDILPVCFMAVIIGGLGNLPGTVAAAILLAFIEGVIASFADPTAARITSLVLMSAVLMFRPQGIFQGGDTMSRSALERTLFALFALFLLTVPWFVPIIADQFWVSIITEILIWSLLAASVNFLFGYVGLLSFGQALFFGMGMYGVAIGVGKFELSFWPAFASGIVLAVLMAAVTGVVAVRLTWHYFAIITVVFSLIFYFLAMTLKPLTGGDDGMVFSLPPTFTWGESEYGLADPSFQYFFILACVAICFYLKYRVLSSPFGRGLVAIRENDTRAALIGLNVYRLRLLAFIVAGFLAGVSGALFALFGRYASASYMFYHVSGEAVVWAIVGGAGTLFGPIVGTSLLIIVREELSSIWENYLLLVGAVAILVVTYAPKGVVGLWNGWVAGLGSRNPARNDRDVD